MLHARTGAQRLAFTLIELLVVLAIISVLLGMLLSSVQKVRASAARLRCAHQLRQIALGSHTAHDAQRTLPPGVGDYPEGGQAFGTYFYHLLPYVEQQALYNQSSFSGHKFVGKHRVDRQPVPLFVCVSDPSVPPDMTATDVAGNVWGVASYAVNAQVVSSVDYRGVMKSPQSYARIPDSFPDGVSNTILLSEKYAQCCNRNYPVGGSLWAYFFVGPGHHAYHAGFSVSWNDYSIGPASKFQVQPSPYDGNCDPTLASSPHPGGIDIALADGSVRFLSSAVTGYTWWYLCTPAGGEVIPSDLF
jgi:prepilin-type N-terminal cleavage/methylation domain-containing protein